MARTRRTAFVAIAAAVALGACASGPDPSKLGELGWMTGCWITQDGMGTQTWSAPVGGMMFGHGVRVTGGRAEFFETSYIDLRGPEQVYSTSPDGLRPAAFVRVRSEALADPRTRSATFANPERDFPQKITYASTGRNTLSAEVSMLDGSRLTRFDWTRCRN